MNEYLFLFTIGPVQSFIAQARKTQDLYAGSFMLSYLTNFAMKDLVRQLNSVEFIFPDEKLKSKPNRFIARIECENPESAGRILEDNVYNEFKTICKIILEDLNLCPPKDFERQINDFLDFYWVALPLEKDNYADTFRELEGYLGAVKNIRHFNQLDETGRKCSLCGERNVLFYKGKKRAYIYNAVSLDNLPPKYMTDGESICAVCFSKRFAEKYFKKDYAKDYPSVAEISLMDWLSKLDHSKYNGYRYIFGKNFDEQLFFEENLKKKYFEKYGYPIEKLDVARSCLENILKENNNGLRSKYYAVLSLDGDSMGRWLSGQNLNDKTQLLKFHKDLTENLGLFSEEVEKIIIKPRGKLVYAGGDDVLAFANLTHLLAIIKELREKFPKFEEFAQVTQDQVSSASCGISIAHYKTPLTEALNWSRKMEKEAKQIDVNKDAFAIAVLRRSGEIHKTVFKWKYNDVKTVDILTELINLLKQKDSNAILQYPQLSDTFIKNLDIEFSRLMDEEGMCQENKILTTEMERLIERSLILRKKTDESKEDFDRRKNEHISNLVNKLNDLNKNSVSLRNFLSFLHIAVFMKKEMN